MRPAFFRNKRRAPYTKRWLVRACRPWDVWWWKVACKFLNVLLDVCQALWPSSVQTVDTPVQIRFESRFKSPRHVVWILFAKIGFHVGFCCADFLKPIWIQSGYAKNPNWGGSLNKALHMLHISCGFIGKIDVDFYALALTVVRNGDIMFSGYLSVRLGHSCEPDISRRLWGFSSDFKLHSFLLWIKDELIRVWRL